MRAVTGLGGSLGIPIVAEGVETPAQVAMLAAENCHYAQGFLFSRPVRADAVPAAAGSIPQCLTPISAHVNIAPSNVYVGWYARRVSLRRRSKYKRIPARRDV